MREWRLIDSGHRSAAENMALDDVIIGCRARELTPNTVRFLQFDPPAVLVGYHQSVEQEVRIEFCESKNIEINRRLTGGGAIFFDKKSLGWEVIASKSELIADHSIEEVYERMCEGTILGLKTLGVQASFRPKNDIEVEGRKISGTGGTELNNTFLFQGTLLIDFDVDTMLRALRIPVMKLKDKEIESVKQRVTCIKWELKQLPTLNDIKNALKDGFERAFKMKLVKSELSSYEENLLKERLDIFKSKKWIFLDRRPLNEGVSVHAVNKTPGGLIRISLALDRELDVIKSALITGDFFVFPSRTILDLEAKLKGASYNENEIRSIVYDFFETRKILIPGVTPDDLVKLISKAIKKMEYESLGISLEEANHIYAVNGNPMSILDNSWEFLLLPYCAKLLACEYRKKDGCINCGKCSMGFAYEMAEKAGLVPLTIQNFEHLIATLKGFREDGVKGYIGCCCEGFYIKHQDDFEAIQVPGILIDIDDKTCYDLGKEKEAYNGSFENQTILKIDLLSKILDICLKKNIHGDEKRG
ncbi:DUF116 domain-containing protein [Candidatus Bathyarchaeota archaeon]|nr:DUF116 domain-containing protein [Candidatus Bathyarchaeota archaeon]